MLSVFLCSLFALSSLLRNENIRITRVVMSECETMFSQSTTQSHLQGLVTLQMRITHHHEFHNLVHRNYSYLHDKLLLPRRWNYYFLLQHVPSYQPLRPFVSTFTYIRLDLYVYTSRPSRPNVFVPPSIHLSLFVLKRIGETLYHFPFDLFSSQPHLHFFFLIFFAYSQKKHYLCSGFG